MQKIFKLKTNKKYFDSLSSKNGLLPHCVEIKIDVSKLNKAGWKALIKQTIISENLFRSYPNEIRCEAFYKFQRLSDDFIREFQDYLDFYFIARYNRRLSEEILIEFQKEFSWELISGQRLSEDFIRKYKDNVSWRNISLLQILSKDFIVEFFDNIDFNNLLRNQNISNEIKTFCKMFI